MEPKEFIVIVYMYNQIGVLNRVTNAYIKGNVNIEKLNVAETSEKGISLAVISAITSEEQIKRVVNLLNNVIDVIEAEYNEPEDMVYKELGIYKNLKVTV
jgi:acetolactate synthase small subunit